MSEGPGTTFARRLNLFDATMIVISGIIGSGIFINPYVVAQLFFRSLARLSPRFRAPSYAVFADWVFFALSGVALLVFRRKLPDAPRPVPVPGYPWVPILFSLAGAGIVFNIFFTDTRNALIGSAIIALGAPVFLLWRAFGPRREGS